MEISKWITEDAVKRAENEMLLRVVSNLMRNRSMSEEEALTAIDVSQEEYDAARAMGFSPKG